MKWHFIDLFNQMFCFQIMTTAGEYTIFLPSLLNYILLFSDMIEKNKKLIYIFVTTLKI